MPVRGSDQAVLRLAGSAACGLRAAGPIVTALMIGLALGTAVSGLVGWQVPKAIARSQLETAVNEQQALFCESQARADNPQASGLGPNARRDLAGKWAIMPGAKSAKRGVTDACARKLAA